MRARPGDEVSTGSGSDRVARSCKRREVYPVATAPGLTPERRLEPSETKSAVPSQQ
jgi:hypothetical protein